MAQIFVFAFDLTEASQIRRIKSFQMLGHTVRSAAPWRANMNTDFVPDWDNIDLGLVENERYGKRIMGLFRSVWLMVQHREALKNADVIVARNFDLLLIAWVTRMLTGRGKAPLVYECLDIHGLFTKAGPTGNLMRWCERRMLARVQLLIVSSPGFITHYFQAVQEYLGPSRVIENKLWFDGIPAPRPQARSVKADRVLTVGWVGSIRCAPSLNLLLATAAHFGDRLNIRIHGNIHRHALPDFEDQIAAFENVRYFGPYAYPTGLAPVYAACDIVWAQDLWQRNANSDWLLPNRIYEASWFGCPSIAVADTETGRKVRSDNLGFTIDQPTSADLIDALERLNHETIAKCSNNLLDRDEDDFMLRLEDVQSALEPVLPTTFDDTP